MTTKTTSHINSLVLKHKRKQQYIHVIEVTTFSLSDGQRINKEVVRNCNQWTKIKDGWRSQSVMYPDSIAVYDVLTMCSMELIKSLNY